MEVRHSSRHKAGKGNEWMWAGGWWVIFSSTADISYFHMYAFRMHSGHDDDDVVVVFGKKTSVIDWIVVCFNSKLKDFFFFVFLFSLHSAVSSCISIFVLFCVSFFSQNSSKMKLEPIPGHTISLTHFVSYIRCMHAFCTLCSTSAYYMGKVGEKHAVWHCNMCQATKLFDTCTNKTLHQLQNKCSVFI